MAHIVVTDRAGQKHAIEAGAGTTLMHTIRDAGIDELLALCGGFCSCATCHVYVDEDWLDILPPRGADETDLLESSDYFLPTSRLSCQIKISEALSGLQARIAPEN